MRKISLAWLALAALWATPLLAAPVSKPISWKIGKQTFSGFLVYDDASTEKRPGLLMVPDWLGVTAASVDKAKQIAGDDYVVLVVDMYGKNVRPKNPEQALAQVKKLYSNRPVMRARMGKALEVLRTKAGKAPVDTSQVAALGYCFGGSSVLELARSGADIAGVVTFHGGLDTMLPAEPGAVKAPLLILNGADDKGVAPTVAAFEKEMTDAGADWQFVNFSGAVHCFALETANSPGCMYNERAAKRANKMMDNFFEEIFAD
ncbi:MAG TPA: dienelactone hydrolase family protein [Pseudoxanthomonas sp.]|nr:dienelactone hydrolase family protein [Pseudoxanthomonas sp.]